MTPIFIFSLPRAGSTLVQRVLSASSEISTISEPWLLLPLLYASRRCGIAADYDHGVMVDAIEAFSTALPNGQNDFDEAIRTFAHFLYEKQGFGRYFIDKTPRYATVSADICRIFPDAKIVFLWRNPLAIMASIIETWGQGRWNLFRYHVDIFDGMQGLLSARKTFGARSIDIKYEDFVENTGDCLALVSSYLSLDFDKDILKSFDQNLIPGKLGDPERGEKYQGIAKGSILSWQNSVKNPLRRWWFRKYLNNLGRENLALMGYDLDEISKDLGDVPLSAQNLFSDCCLMAYGYFYRKFNLPVLRKQLSQNGIHGVTK